MTASRNTPSSKFWLNQSGRKIVQSAPDSRTVRSAAISRSSPMASMALLDSSTMCLIPRSTANRTNEGSTGSSCGAMRYIREAPATAGSHVAGSDQSKRTSPRREAARTEAPAARSRPVSLRPVVPVAPSTRISSFVM